MSRPVPAWTLAVSEHSTDDYVYVLDKRPSRTKPGEHEVKLTHRLTPVRKVGEDRYGSPVVDFR